MPQRHLDRLTSFDTSFLSNERHNAHMAIGAVFICEGEAPSLDDFLAHIRARLHLLPRLRQRLAFPPFGLGRPLWVDDPDFEIGKHVRRVTLPAPGSEAQFRELIGPTLSPPLDRSKPLWELCLVDGLEHDRFGLIYKTHHAMADGISAVDIGILLFDAEPKFEPPAKEAPWNPHAPPSEGELVGEAVRGVGKTLRRLIRWLSVAVRHPRRASKRASDGAAGVWEVSWALTRPAPKVPLNTPIGPERWFCWHSCDLNDFKAIKNKLGGTVNDVCLAVAATALRGWLSDRGLSTEGPHLQALVPVSIRAENEHGELGNKLTAMRGPLPVGVADPLQRLQIITKAMDDLKASKQPLGAEAIWALNDWFRDFAPPILLGPTAKINFSTRLFNLLVTNFPGPQIPFYVMGHELLELFPVGFLAQQHALAIAILSYNGKIGFGLLADKQAVADVEQIAGYVDGAVAELLALAGIGSAPTGVKAAHG
jgi:diacylglycerol O-acyltransferase